jgi:hypothetical protein
VSSRCLRWLSPDVQETIVSAPVIANTRALIRLLLVVLLYVLAFLQARQRDDRRGAPERAVMILGASALTIAVITTEIQSYWEVQALRGDDTSLAREAMLSARVGAYAAVAIALGFAGQYVPIRTFAIALFGLTLAKVVPRRSRDACRHLPHRRLPCGRHGAAVRVVPISARPELVVGFVPSSTFDVITSSIG